MIEIYNSELLQRWLLESGHLGRLWGRPRFLFDRAEFEREVAGVRKQYPRFTSDEAEARAALRLLGKEEAHSRTRSIAAVAGKPHHWTRRERLFLAAVVLLAALVALLLCTPRAHAQSRSFGMQPASRAEYVLGQPRPWDPQGQPVGIIIQVQNQGSTILTRPAGLLVLNFSTNLSASASANTITVTATGGSGSGCIPPGSTANALLFDAGSGTCSDVSKLTYASSTLTGASGLTVDFSAASALKLSGTNTSGLPGTTGQLLYNNGGNLGAEDPVVSGPDARAAAQSKNPVAGLAGIDYGTGCSSGPCVQEAKVDSSGNVYVDVTNIVPVSGTFWQTTQPVSLASLPALATGANTIGAVTQASGPWTINLTQLGGSNVGQSNPLYVQPTDGTHNMPMGDAAARTIHVTADNSSIAVTGTFWQATQPVSIASLPALPADQSVNVAQIAGSNVIADPCQTTAPTSLAINEATSSLTTIISGVSGKHTYICSIFLISATAQNVNLVSGTGTNCGTTVHVGFFGGTTAATGPNLAANGGWTLGNGANTIAGGTDTAADNICFTASGTGQVSGVLRYVQQ